MYLFRVFKDWFRTACLDIWQGLVVNKGLGPVAFLARKKWGATLGPTKMWGARVETYLRSIFWLSITIVYISITGVTEHSQNDVHNDLIKLFLMPYNYYGVFQCVAGRKTYSIRERKVNRISIHTIHQWNPSSLGFLKMYFITRTILGFQRILLESKCDFIFFNCKRLSQQQKNQNVIVTQREQ